MQLPFCPQCRKYQTVDGGICEVCQRRNDEADALNDEFRPRGEPKDWVPFVCWTAGTVFGFIVGKFV